MRLRLRIAFYILGLAASFLRAQPLDDASTSELVAGIVAHGEGRGTPAQLIREAGKRGVEAALACAEQLDPEKPRLSQHLYEVIKLAGRIRRLHHDVLRLYDPAAYRLFYEKEAEKEQKKIAVGLNWPKLPRALPGAVVRSAPLATFDWMKEQARSNKPHLEHLKGLLREWGWWVWNRNERQHSNELYKTLKLLSESDAVLADSNTLIALLQTLGQKNDGCLEGRVGHQLLSDMEAFAIRSVESKASKVRAEAAGALGRFASGTAHKSLLQRLAVEKDPTVLGRIAEALGGWTEEHQKTGKTMLSLFKSCDNAGVRKEILYSNARSHWPNRDQIILEAFRHPGEGVLGVALESIPGTKITPEIADEVIKTVQSQKKRFPALIDAAGAVRDARAVTQLARWLKIEKNDAIRLKIVLALEKIGGGEAKVILLNLLQKDASAMLVEHLIAVADRMKLQGAISTLLKLARDETAPLSIRNQAIWSLAALDSFGLSEVPESDMEPAEAEVLRAFVALARFRQGIEGAPQVLLRTYRSGSPTVRLHILMRLEEIRRDHAVIGLALDSSEFIELYGAVRAAGATNPFKYNEKLKSLKKSRFVSAMMNSSLDLLGFKDYLNRALVAGLMPEGF